MRWCVPSFKAIGLLVPKEEIFNILSYMGLEAILVMWPRNISINFHSNIPWKFFGNLQLKHFPIQKQKGPNLTLLYNRSRSTEGHHLNKFRLPKLPMLHTKFQGHRPFGSRKDDFKGFYHIMCMAAILVMWHKTICIYFYSLIPWRLHIKFGFNRHSG